MLCIHESQKFNDHDRERKQKIKLKKKNNKQQGTTEEEPGRSKLSILTSHSSNCAYQCCNHIYFSGTTFVSQGLTGVRSISHTVVWFLLRVEKEDLTLLFLTQHIWSLFYFPPVKTGVNTAGGGGPIVAHTQTHTHTKNT